MKECLAFQWCINHNAVGIVSIGKQGYFLRTMHELIFPTGKADIGEGMNTKQKLQLLRRQLDTADAVVIGAGAGLSTAAGFTYSGPRFSTHFADFEAKYGFHDMYSGGFYPYATQEEHWAYWSRYIHINRYEDAPIPVYTDLLSLVADKDSFVLTTNVDHCFQKAGFDKKRLFYTQGDYGLFQCSRPCHQATYSNEDIICRMVAQQQAMRVPTALLPFCPKCGMPMTMNLRSDNRFVEDEGWRLAAKRYEHFLCTHSGQRVLYLELGVGYNTPGIIKYPFWQMTAENKNATYACINLGEASCPAEIARRVICVNGDVASVIGQLRQESEANA